MEQLSIKALGLTVNVYKHDTLTIYDQKGLLRFTPGKKPRAFSSGYIN
jgi:hypothetical protein